MKLLYPDGILKLILILIIGLFLTTPIVLLLEKLGRNNAFSLIVFAGFFVNVTIISALSLKKVAKRIFYPSEFKFSLKIKDIYSVSFIAVVFFLLTATYNYIFRNTSSDDISLYYAFGAILLAPIVEEWIFRGVFLKSLLTKHSERKSIIISSGLFAIIHIYPVQIIGAFVLGMYFGNNYSKEKSILNVIILHAIANTIGIVLMKFINFENIFS